MTSYRNAIRFCSLVLSLGLSMAASAATFDVKTLIDTDNSRSTGCNVATPGGIVSGIDVIVTTSGTVTGNNGTVTAVTRQTCVNPVLSQFSSATAVDSGWTVGVSPIGDVFVESHMGLDVLTMDNIGTPRFVFTSSSGLSSDVLLTPWSWGGGDIIMPHAARDRSSAPLPPRNILLDGANLDWAGNVPLANGTAASPVWRFITASAYAGLHDLFFSFRIHTNPAAPTAHDDNYALSTLGGTLTVATLGVLNNDNANNQPITASLVDTTQHGTLALAPDGGFTYVHDGSLASQDQFHYVAVGTTLSSNVATVTIDLPGTHPYTFTSADNVTFIAGQPNTFTVTVTGKPTPALSVDGALPAGITFQDNGNGTGVLSGTPGPNTSGTYALVFFADKNKPHSSSQNFTLTVTCPGVSVVNPVVNSGQAGTPFSQTFTQNGGTPPVTFALNTGTLPPGLTLSPAGVLSGTPTASGAFTFTVKVTDAGGCTAVGGAYNLNIVCQPITITNPATASGTVNAAFSQTFTQSGAISGATFSLNSGTLPAGLTLSAAGVLSGTPTQPGSFPITVKVTDGQGCTGISGTYTLVIGCQIITVNNPATNSGTVATAFSQTFTSSNTIGAVTYSTASTLPAGLTLSSGGVLAGTPTQTGTFSIVVKATDANGCFGNGATYNLTINCQTITVNNPATNTGTVNIAFSQSFTAPAAIGTKTFTLNSGTLPAGLTLSAAGVLSGTPTQTGSFPITVHVVDANGCSANSATYTLTIGCQVITVNNPATNTGTVNVAFSQSFTTTNAIGAVTYTTASTLPTGLTLSAAGVLSGTPTQSGSFAIVVHAVDANACSGNSSTYTLVIGCQTITVTNPATNTGTVNTLFGQSFTSGNTIGTVTYSTASTLPAGLTLSSGGVLSGTPTQTGSFPIVVKATDANGCFGSGATYTLTIGCQTITVNNPATTTGTVNAAFSQSFTAGNTVGALTFTTASPLPSGLSLSTAGVLSGTPTQTGSFPIVVHVVDGNGCSANGATYTLVIGCQTIVVTNPATNTGTVSAPFTVTFTSGNTIGTVSYSTASTLPAGITLNSATGVLSGTPTQSGTFPIVVTATDANGCSGNGATYTLVIGCQVITVNNPATTSSPAGVPLSINFTQSGAIGAVTFSTASTLPTGLTLAANGTLSGTPSGSGAFPIVVTVTDSNNCTGTNPAYTLTITCPTITVTNPAVSSGTAGVAFSQTFTQAGGQGTITWSESGALPSGITLNSGSGVLSGTTNTVGSFPITVTATDANGCPGSGALYTLTINCQTITVTNPGVNSGTVDAAFSQTFTQTGILGTVTWSESGTLPPGITLNSASGVLSGTPTVNGTFSIIVKATDTNGCFGTSSYTLTINCQTITVTNPGVTAGTVDAAFSQTFTQAGAHDTFTFTTGSTLPAGLSLSTAGVLSGTPTVKGSFPIVVTVTDVNGCSGTGSTYTLVIGCQTITVTNPATTSGTAGVAFSQTFTQSGAHGTATFTTASTLPTGFTLSNAGVLSGTTTQHGSFPIVVTVTDANTCTGTSATYTLVIACNPISVTNPATSSGTVSAAFSQTFTQSGSLGTPAFTTASTLPAGLTLHSATGILDGTPTQAGTFPIVVTVTDANGCTGTSATYTLIIACQTINVSNPATTSSQAGTPLSINFTQTGAIGAVTFTTSSTLPAGLTLAANGTLSGTPSGSGAFPIVVTVTDVNNCTGTNPAYTLTITCPTITVTNPGVSTGTAGVAFNQTFTQAGGQGTITWSETGALPAGITLNSASGILSGTTNAAGSFPITVKATDANGCFGTSAYTLTINCQTITVTNPGVNTGTVDAAFSQTFTKTGILGTVSWSETGTLPAGITLNAASGVLSGTPTVNGSFPITVKATDTNGCFGTSAYTLTINCQTITVTNPGTTTGTVNAPFSQTFTQTGVGTHTPATFTINSGTLPSGLTLSSAGVLSGTPAVPGSFPITVKVTDANGCTGISPTYTLVIACQTITVTNPGVTTGTVNAAFSQTFTQTGAVGTAVFTTASTLPTGFTLSSAGVLSGTTQQHASFPIVVTVTDSNNCTGTSATYTLVINCQTITVTNPGVTTGTVGAPFSQQFTQTGGIGATTFTTASTLPTGITLDSAGLLSGTPLQPGSFPIVVTATDSNGCTGTSATYTLVISCNVITVTNPATTTGTVDAAFSQTFTQSGGNGTIVWSKTGAIPAGTTFNTSTGVLSGTPTAPGSFPITVTATDANGCAGTGSTYTLVISCQTITVTAPGVTTGTVDAPFSQTFTQSGVGTHTPAVFSINSGTLPSGLTLSAAGVLSGTPLVPGSFPITVKVTDANGCTGISGTYTLVIACQTITVTNPATTVGVFSTAFSQTFTQSGVGTHTPAVFTINSGTLPTGLSLSSAGVLSGTPTQTGTFPITVKVTDANGCTGIGATYNLAITPNVGNDAYGTVNALVDNTQAYVTGGTTATPTTPAIALSGFVTANDTPLGAVTVTAGTFATSQGGSVLIQSDGSFLYTPGVHAAAITSDSFTYTGTSNTGGTATPTSAVGTVNLTLANRVWYVSNNGGGTNGQSQSPFTTLAAAAAASTANDIIFVYNGNGTNSGQNAGITLKNGQQLLGEINGLVVNTATLVAVGSRPTIGNSAGDGVTVPATAGSVTGVFIKGLSIAGTANGINISSTGANTLTATVDNVNITAATANNGIRISGGSSGTSTVTVQNSTVNAAGQNGIDAQQTVAGTLVLSINNDTITATGTGININGAGSTSTTITNFAGNTITGNTGGTGVNMNTVTFDATPGGSFQTVSGGNTAIGSVGNGVGASGMVLTTVKGDLSFTDLDIVTSNGPGLFASSAAAFNSGTGTGFQIVSTGTPTIDATGGPAADLTTVTANLPFVTIKSATSSTTGVNLVTVLGTFTAGVGSTITSATGTDFNINGGTATVTYDGTITDSTSRLVAVTGATGGTKTFTGAISDSGGGTGTGISLTTNTGATINFTGQLTLTTGGNDAFTATGGGTVSASNVNSTIVSTSGKGVNIANTTIGGSGVKFKSISVNGAANGIVLNTTGAGAFTVIGDGGGANNASGGTIQATTAEAILLTGASNVSIGYMNITNPGTDGIAATGVNGLTINRCNITDAAGNTTIDDGLQLSNTSGVLSITNTSIAAARHQGITVDNNNTNMTSMTITGSSVTNTPGGDGILIQMRGTSVMTTGTIGGAGALANTISGNSATGLQVNNIDTGNIAGLTILNNTISNNNGGIDLDVSPPGASLTVTVQSNTITGSNTNALNLVTATTNTSGSLTATIRSNNIGTAGVFDSGSKIGNGIRVANGGVNVNLTIDSNVIREVPNARGIDIEAQAYAVNNNEKVKIINNTVARPSGTTANIGCGAGVPCPQASIFVLSDSNGGAGFDKVCTAISGNTVYDPTSWAAGSESAFYFARRTSASNTLQVEGTQANVTNQMTSTNTITNLTTAPGVIDEGTSGTVTIVAAGTCGGFPP
jgi:hypothetical protein